MPSDVVIARVGVVADVALHGYKGQDEQDGEELDSGNHLDSCFLCSCCLLLWCEEGEMLMMILLSVQKRTDLYREVATTPDVNAGDCHRWCKLDASPRNIKNYKNARYSFEHGVSRL